MFQHKQKYIVTKDDVMIVFSDLLEHSDFRGHNPISAGFLSIGATAKYEPTIQCYGESISLGIKSREEEDTALAKRQILGNTDY
jgi:hypothetical protein